MLFVVLVFYLSHKALGRNFSVTLEIGQTQKLVTDGVYRYVRHPLLLGFIIAFWATPDMTGGRLLFAIVTTAYILVAIQFEERNLEEDLAGYADYKKRVPMLIPFTGGDRKAENKAETAAA